jgi:broad specificity phosphatase PhoE
MQEVYQALVGIEWGVNNDLPLRLTFVRHAVTDWNLEGRWQGWSDVPLGEAGRVQAKSLQTKLSAINYDLVFSSDLSRAIETATLAGFEPTLEPRLREIHFGNIEGKINQEVQAHPGFQTWLADPMHTKIEGGESYFDLQTRAFDWLENLPESGEILAFTHGGVVHTLVPKLLETTTFAGPRWWRFQVLHASITKLERWRMPNGQFAWTLTGLNDTTHLEHVFAEK